MKLTHLAWTIATVFSCGISLNQLEKTFFSTAPTPFDQEKLHQENSMNSELNFDDSEVAYIEQILNEILVEIIDEFNLHSSKISKIKIFNPLHLNYGKELIQCDQTIFFSISLYLKITNIDGGRNGLAFKLLNQLIIDGIMQNSQNCFDDYDEESNWRAVEIRTLKLLSNNPKYDVLKIIEILKSTDKSP